MPTMRARRLLDLWILVCTLAAASCSGGGGCGGCGGMTPIPNGFPADKRTTNAAQVRVSQTGLAAIESNPAAIIGPLIGGTGSNISFNVPSSCGGSTPICCPGGTAQDPCGPIDIDLTLHPGDDARLVLAPQQGASTLDVTVRARVQTGSDIPVTVPVIGDCGLHVDTTQGSTPDLEIDMPIQFVQDATVGTTRIQVGTVAIQRLESSDVALTGSLGCEFASFGISFFISTIESALTSQIASTVQQQTCKACPMGDECGSFASCVSGTCEEGSGSAQVCLQELGLDGRMLASALFGSFSPGTTGALDLYEVAGGYGTTDSGGIALGLLGGMEPGGSARDACGPPATEPAPATIPVSPTFQGNTDPNGSAFDVAIGIHKSQLAQLAFAGYDGGLFCLTITHATVSQLTTDTIGLRRDLSAQARRDRLADGGRAAAAEPADDHARQQHVHDDGTGKVVDPLLDIKFTALEIDFFASVDDQYIRVFTVVADVHLPIGLQTTGMGQLTPVIGDATHAFTNVSVKNSEAVTERPAELAALFPTLLGLVLPQLSSGLGSISLPAHRRARRSRSTASTSTDNNTFLAIFANLQVAQAAVRVHTRADISKVTEPSDDVMSTPTKWATSRPPSVQLALGGDAADLEWQLRVDGGFWEPWSANATPTIAATVLAAGHAPHRGARAARRAPRDDRHRAVHARDRRSVTAPRRPRRGTAKAPDFHGQGDGAGCNCDAAAARAAGALLGGDHRAARASARRRLRRVLGARRGSPRSRCLPGCSCGNAPCGDTACWPATCRSARSAGGRASRVTTSA